MTASNLKNNKTMDTEKLSEMCGIRYYSDSFIYLIQLQASEVLVSKRHWRVPSTNYDK